MAVFGSIIKEERTNAGGKVIPLPPIADPESVYYRYADMVYRLALARCRKKSDAEDVMQEVFMRYVKYRPEFASEEHQKAWLVKATINCSNTWLKSLSRYNASELDENTSSLDDRLNDTAGDVYAAVMRLPKNLRTAIHLYYYEGYKISEIASVTDTNENTVKSWLRRAKERLEKELKGDYFDV